MSRALFSTFLCCGLLAGACRTAAPPRSTETTAHLPVDGGWRADFRISCGGDAWYLVHRGTALPHEPYEPAVLHASGERRRLFPLPRSVVGAAWQAAATGPDTIVGVLDNAIESPGWELTFCGWRPSDGPRAEITLTTLRKPYYLARLVSFEIDGDRWTAVIYLDDDYGSPHRVGHYRYISTDRGRTWSEAAHRAPAPPGADPASAGDG